MKRFTIRIVLLCILSIPALGKARQSASSAPPLTVCTLVTNPKDFAGKLVTVTATIVSNSEYNFLKDDSCPISGRSDVVEVTFDEDEAGVKSGTYHTLTRLLKKNMQAQVTAVGVFIDPGQYIGHQSCCRYQLKVHKVLTVRSRAHSR
jgi:hypothetical protein